MVDRCVMCGEIIPEGRKICPLCSGEIDMNKFNISTPKRIDHHLVYNQQTPREQVGD